MARSGETIHHGHLSVNYDEVEWSGVELVQDAFTVLLGHPEERARQCEELDRKS
jgi:hypothetical protein